MKVLGIIGIVISSLGLLGSLTLIGEGAFWGFIVYTFYLILSILAYQNNK